MLEGLDKGSRFYQFHADREKRELEIKAFMDKPGLERQVAGIAATLNDTFNATTRVMIDIRPGAVLLDEVSKLEWIYEGSIIPYEFDVATSAILRVAQHPEEVLKDMAYALIRPNQIGAKQVVLSLQDFAKLVAIKRFSVKDFAISDERELTKNLQF